MDGTKQRAHKVTVESVADLYRRPGFLIRRCFQVSASIFTEECASLDLTTRQYGILVMLNEKGGLSQRALALALGLDRSTTAMVVGLMERKGWIHRERDPEDARRRIVTITAGGEDILHQAQPMAIRAKDRLLAGLSPDEQTQFLSLMEKILAETGDAVRVPLEWDYKPARD